MDRQQANIKLAYILMELIKESPGQRFGQILQNFDFIKYTDGSAWVNEFYVEPQKLLERVETKLNAE